MRHCFLGIIIAGLTVCLMLAAGVASGQDTQGLIDAGKLTPLDIPTKPVNDDRPESWAVPLELEGVPNFYRVTDQLYRSAQPTEEGMENLKKYGFETIISLRVLHSRPENHRHHRFGLRTNHHAGVES